MLGKSLKTYASQLKVPHPSQLKADLGVFGWEGDIGWFDVGIVTFWKKDLQQCSMKNYGQKKTKNITIQSKTSIHNIRHRWLQTSGARGH